MGCGYHQVADAVHTMNQTKTAFWLSIKREERHQSELFDEVTTPYAYHVVDSNWPQEEKSADEVLVWHNQRGQAENFNKELKHGLGLEQIPCGDFGANAVFFRIGVLAYNLFMGFKRLACPASVGVADDREAGAGRGANSPSCGAVGFATRVGCRGARLLAHHPPAMRGAGRGALMSHTFGQTAGCWRKIWIGLSPLAVRERAWTLGAATTGRAAPGSLGKERQRLSVRRGVLRTRICRISISGFGTISSLTSFSPLTYYDDLKYGGHVMGFAISPKELKTRLDKGDKLILVDVREEWEYSLAKLHSSILIPLGTLPQSLARLNRDSEIIAICHHGMRSADATNFLLQQGFPNVKNLVGGIDAWSIHVDGTVPRYQG